MDRRFQNLPNLHSPPFKPISNLMLRLDNRSPSVPALQISSGAKRKFSLVYGAPGGQFASSLSLGLGHSSSSSDIQGSSITNSGAASPPHDFDLNAAPKEAVSLDLELSLCTGSSPESEITEISSGPPIVQAHEPTMPPLPILPNPSSSSAITCSTVSSGITKKLRTGTSTKICQVEGCNKGARGASGRCISHGGGRRCQRPGCPKGAEGRTPYCKAHGGGRRCDHLGCTKSAEGRTDFCIAHGGGRRCNHEGGCTKAARGKSGLCIRHGGGKRCRKDGCTRSAEGLSGLCISHGGGRRCQFPGGCSKGAQGSTAFCKAHGGGKRCTFPNCGKGAEGSTAFCKAHGGGKRCSYGGGGVCSKSVHGGTNFCVAHGGGKRCAVAECTRSARGRTAYCVRHGGGKRCIDPGCGKSAQGSTDFCKAHGGGKRCSWGQGGICTAFARGRNGLCALHNGVAQERRVHGAAGIGPIGMVNDPGLTTENVGTDLTSHHGSDLAGSSFGFPSASQKGFVFPASSSIAGPEGRVHGGSFMAILNSGVGGSILTGHDDNEESPVMPRGWI